MAFFWYICDSLNRMDQINKEKSLEQIEKAKHKWFITELFLFGISNFKIYEIKQNFIESELLNEKILSQSTLL